MDDIKDQDGNIIDNANEGVQDAADDKAAEVHDALHSDENGDHD